MTGTAATEANEFMDIYGLDVVEIPTNVPVAPPRRGRRGLSHGAREVGRDHRRRSSGRRARKQPMLVGTMSIEKSEQLSELLKDSAASSIRCCNAALSTSRKASHHRPGRRAAARSTHRHQHGRPRHRHPARRQRRFTMQESHRAGRRDRRGQSRPAWPVAAPTFSSAATIEAEGWIASNRDDVREPAETVEMRAGQGRRRRREDAASKPGGLYVHRHRAPREPPHRQPAARPLRPPGRSRPLEVLPVARRRPDAHLRLRAHGRHAADARPARKARRSSIRGSTRRWRRRRRRSRRATSTSASTS